LVDQFPLVRRENEVCDLHHSSRCGAGCPAHRKYPLLGFHPQEPGLVVIGRTDADRLGEGDGRVAQVGEP